MGGSNPNHFRDREICTPLHHTLELSGKEDSNLKQLVLPLMGPWHPTYLIFVLPKGIEPSFTDRKSVVLTVRRREQIFFCDPEWIQTIDNLIKSEVLYSTELRGQNVVMDGIEPPTPRSSV